MISKNIPISFLLEHFLQHDQCIIFVIGRYELNEIVRLIMYPSVIRNLFGENVLPIHDEKSMRDLMDNFVIYDDQFEYGTQIPQIFLRYDNMHKFLIQVNAKLPISTQVRLLLSLNADLPTIPVCLWVKSFYNCVVCILVTVMCLLTTTVPPYPGDIAKCRSCHYLIRFPDLILSCICRKPLVVHSLPIVFREKTTPN